MPTLGNLTLADGQVSPVNHTFTAINVDSAGVARYEDQVSGVPIGFGRLSISLKRPTNGLTPGTSSKSAVYRAHARIEIPVLEVTSASTGTGIQPSPTIAYSTMYDISAVIPARATLADRKDSFAYAKNFLANAVATDVFVNLLPVN
jgi:hypothetical protein